MQRYAAIPPLVTLPKSVALHSATDLTYADCDETSGIVHFTAPSGHKPGTRNTVSLDTYTGHIFCDCKGASCDRLCWHCCYVTAAWQAHPAVAEARVLSAARLLTCCDEARTFAPRSRPVLSPPKTGCCCRPSPL